MSSEAPTLRPSQLLEDPVAESSAHQTKQFKENVYLPKDRSLELCHAQWILDPAHKLGSASTYATIVEACRAAEKENCSFIAKISVLDTLHRRWAFYRDAYILSQLQDEIDLVPKLEEAPWTCERGHMGYIVMARMKSDVASLVKANDSILRPAMLRKMAQALNRLTEKGLRIYHGDIKLANFLVTRRNDIRLIDFGLAHSFTKPFPFPSPFIFGSLLPWRKDQTVIQTLSCRGQITEYHHDINLWALEVLILCHMQARKLTIQGGSFAGFDSIFDRNHLNRTYCHTIVVEELGGGNKVVLTGDSLRFPWEEFRQAQLGRGLRPFKVQAPKRRTGVLHSTTLT